MHESFLVHDRLKYLKRASALCITAVLAYIFTDPAGGHNGGTWLGYTLGVIAALMMVWLAWFGVRKRRYGAGNYSLKGWLSAHVWFGVSLITLVTLHAGFEIGWNVHSLAYVLMMLVIGSGLFGVYVYARYPALMTRNRHGLTRDFMLRQIAEQDQQCAEIALPLGDQIMAEVTRARDDTSLGGSAWRQLTGRYPRCGTTRALANLRQLARKLPLDQADAAARLLVAMGRRKEVVERVRRDIQLKAWMDVWLYVHVPLTFALFGALLAHIVAVLWYFGGVE